jgi:hypothetical protein
MKNALICALLLAVAAPTIAKDTYTKPYIRKDGTYVSGHYKSAPDSTKLNNYSTKGNVNPYTGEDGTVDPYKVQPTQVQPYRAAPVAPTPVAPKTCYKDMFGKCY